MALWPEWRATAWKNKVSPSFLRSGVLAGEVVELCYPVRAVDKAASPTARVGVPVLRARRRRIGIFSSADVEFVRCRDGEGLWKFLVQVLGWGAVPVAQREPRMEKSGAPPWPTIHNGNDVYVLVGVKSRGSIKQMLRRVFSTPWIGSFRFASAAAESGGGWMKTKKTTPRDFSVFLSFVGVVYVKVLDRRASLAFGLYSTLVFLIF